MEINKQKVCSILYILSIMSVFGVIFAETYCLTFGSVMWPSPHDMFLATTIVYLSLAFITFLCVLLNIFTNDKLFWAEIACAFISLIACSILLAFNSKNMYASSIQLIWFEFLSALAMLLISRLCGKFLKKKKEKKQKLSQNSNQTETIQVESHKDKSHKNKKKNKSPKKSLISLIVCAILFVCSLGACIKLCLAKVGTENLTFGESNVASCSYKNTDNTPYWLIKCEFQFATTYFARYEVEVKLYEKDSDMLLLTDTIELGIYTSGQYSISFVNLNLYKSDNSDAYTKDSFYLTLETINVLSLENRSAIIQNYIGYGLIAVTSAFAGATIYFVIDYKKQKNKLVTNTK